MFNSSSNFVSLEKEREREEESLVLARMRVLHLDHNCELITYVNPE